MHAWWSEELIYVVMDDIHSLDLEVEGVLSFFPPLSSVS